ncbi:MAG: hypothetical protein M1828_001463 [Chrysothrix sp. TS-e1954]|nr:MAG: hypothetical protein M1828_001463 [Chrysothrix sp. TS-e1954]
MDDKPRSTRPLVRRKTEPKDQNVSQSRWSASTMSTVAQHAAGSEAQFMSYYPTETNSPTIKRAEDRPAASSPTRVSFTRSSSQQTSGSIPIILQVEDKTPPLPPLPQSLPKQTLKEPRLTPRRHAPPNISSAQDDSTSNDAPSSSLLRSRFYVEDSSRQASSAGSSRLGTPIASPPRNASGISSPTKQSFAKDIQVVSAQAAAQAAATGNQITTKAKSIASRIGTIRSQKTGQQGAYSKLEGEAAGDIAMATISNGTALNDNAKRRGARDSFALSHTASYSGKIPVDPEQTVKEATGQLTGGLGSGMDNVIETNLRVVTDLVPASDSTVKSPFARKRLQSFRHPRSLMPGRAPSYNPAQDHAEKSGQIVAVEELVHVDISNFEGPQAGVTQRIDLDRLAEKPQQSFYFPPDPQMPDWRPFPMQLWYTLTLICIAIILAGVQEYLCQISQRSATGLLKFTNPDEVGQGDWFVWKYLPTIVLVSYGVAWQAKDFEIRRLEPYYQLSKPTGATAAESLNIDYLTFWSYLIPFKAMRYRQWAVASSSLATLLSSALVPVLQSASLNMIRSPKNLKEIVVSPVWSRLMEATLLLVAILGIFLIFQLRRKSGLLSDPKGIAGIAAMANRSHILNDFKDLDLVDNAAIHKQLRHRRYILHKSTLWQGEFIKHMPGDETPEFKKVRSPHPIILQLKVGLPYMASIAAFLALLPVFTFTGANVVVVKLPWLLTLCATLVKLAWSNLEASVRLIEPFYGLSRRHAPPRTLTTDYTGTVPGWMPIKALLNDHYLLSVVGFCSLLTEVMTVCVSSLNVNGRAFAADDDAPNAGANTGDAETFKSFWISLVLAVLILLFLILTAAIVYLRRRHHFLPRQPGTIASVLAFIHQSRMLYDFVSPESERHGNGMRIEELDGVEMTRHLVERGKTYGLGWYRGRDGRDHLGIDEEELLANYKHGYDWRKGRVGTEDIGSWEHY